MDQVPTDFIDVAELSRRVGVSESALHKQRMNGTGPPYCKIGARVLYRWSDVLAWLDQRKARSVAEHRSLAKHRPALSKMPSRREGNRTP